MNTRWSLRRRLDADLRFPQRVVAEEPEEDGEADAPAEVDNSLGCHCPGTHLWHGAHLRERWLTCLEILPLLLFASCALNILCSRPDYITDPISHTFSWIKSWISAIAYSPVRLAKWYWGLCMKVLEPWFKFIMMLMKWIYSWIEWLYSFFPPWPVPAFLLEPHTFFNSIWRRVWDIEDFLQDSLRSIYSFVFSWQPANASKSDKAVKKIYNEIYSLNISATGPASQHLKSLMGQYVKIEGAELHGRPVWMKTAYFYTSYFYYNRFSRWMVKTVMRPWFIAHWFNKEDAQGEGDLKSTSFGQDGVQEQGWLYWDASKGREGSRWRTDPTIRVTGQTITQNLYNVNSPPSVEYQYEHIQIVTISSTGQANDYFASWMGRYNRIAVKSDGLRSDDEVNRHDTPVFLHERGKGFFYFQDNFWSVGPDYKSFAWGVKSPWRCPHTPTFRLIPQYGWYFYDGQYKLPDHKLKVVAHTDASTLPDYRKSLAKSNRGYSRIRG